MKRKENPQCKRCGQCCNVVKYDEHTGKYCGFMQRQPDGTTKCKVYFRNRLGRTTGRTDGVISKCGLREQTPYNYPWCEFNRPEWKYLKNYPLQEYLDKHRKETTITCPEDCECWDIEAEIIKREEEKEKQKNETNTNNHPNKSNESTE